MTNQPAKNNISADLTQKKCVPCSIDTPPLSNKIEDNLLKQISGWELDRTQVHQLYKELTFKNFVQALQFVNQVGELAESEGHHPNIYLHDYNKVKIELYTHKIKGLSDNDFVMAAKIDQLAATD